MILLKDLDHLQSGCSVSFVAATDAAIESIDIDQDRLVCCFAVDGSYRNDSRRFGRSGVRGLRPVACSLFPDRSGPEGGALEKLDRFQQTDLFDPTVAFLKQFRDPTIQICDLGFEPPLPSISIGHGRPLLRKTARDATLESSS